MTYKKSRRNNGDKCPMCGRFDLRKIEEYKKNWYHGKNSTARKVLRRIKKVCQNCDYKDIKGV